MNASPAPTELAPVRPAPNKQRTLARVFASVILLTTLLSGVIASPLPTAAEARPLPASGVDCPHMTDSITRLYSAYFLRSPDAVGFSFWVDQFSTGQQGLESMSEFFSSSDEFRALYDDLSNAEFVDLVYRNVLGRPAEPEGRAFWIGQLESGALTRGTVMINFSESEEYVQRTGTSVPLAGYFNWYPEGTHFSCGTGHLPHPLGSDHDSVDMLAVHDGSVSEPAWFWTVVAENGQALPALASDAVPAGAIALQTYDVNRAATGIAVSDAPPDLASYLVSYEGDMPFFTERSGWRADERQLATFEIERAMRDAEFAVDQFWQQRFPTISDAAYDPPQSFGFYDGYSVDFPVDCDGTVLPPLGAFYCRGEHFVAYDLTLMHDGQRLVGEFFPALVVAHEWAHGIQNRLQPSLVSSQRELQADCLAGATLGTSDAADLVAAYDFVDSHADPTHPEAIPTASRVESFNLGVSGGVNRCLGNDFLTR